ncbi:DUF1697 domain-containing protein [Oceaniglobus roseus]|uniref:DUF1697 domain-containing protein n=1 Tax=Oceaniglobus roseus TaxID=1737570 RepID=UPI000C7ECAA7|nr:DUF1697 domain-containing protein [Kandeliimicrobium roseum]
MTWRVALLRAVNVGGTGRLKMSDLRAVCEAAGFRDVSTVLASGNAVFRSEADEWAIRAALGDGLAQCMGVAPEVILRTGPEIAAALAASPFRDCPPARVAVVFLDAPPLGAGALEAKGRQDERFEVIGREIHVHYLSGMGRSKLVIPAARAGTARNLATVARLAEATGG